MPWAYENIYFKNKFITIFCYLAEVVLETRRTQVPLSILHQAYSEIKATGLSLSDMVCQKGFTNSYMTSDSYQKAIASTKKGTKKGTKGKKNKK